MRGFLGDVVSVRDPNRKSPLDLIARSFDPALFSVCEWLPSFGVGARCIAYQPVEIFDERLIGFSVTFARSPDPIYALEFASPSRTPSYYRHDTGDATDDWSRFLVEHGETLQRVDTEGGTIVPYAKGCGAVGWGVIDGLHALDRRFTGSA